MDASPQTYVPAPDYPDACPRCRSGFRAYDGGPVECVVRYACGSRWVATKSERDTWSVDVEHACKVGDLAVCANCDSIKCMHFVCRDWDAIDDCDGWCCPDCRPVDHDQPLPENWREMPATPRFDEEG